MTSFDYRPRYDLVPLGPLTHANKSILWPKDGNGEPNIIFDDDPNGNFQSIINDPTKGKCTQHLYPANTVGGAGHAYQLGLPAPTAAVTLEFDFLVKGGFDMTHGGGKIPPKVFWGLWSGANAGVVTMLWWSTTGGFFDYVLQNQPDGTQYVQPVVHGPVFARDHWYHFQMEMLGGPSGYSKWWLDGALALTHTGQVGNTAIGQNAGIDICGFYGGGPGAAPPSDGFVLTANVHVFSGTVPPASFITVNSCVIS